MAFSIMTYVRRDTIKKSTLFSFQFSFNGLKYLRFIFSGIVFICDRLYINWIYTTRLLRLNGYSVRIMVCKCRENVLSYACENWTEKQANHLKTRCDGDEKKKSCAHYNVLISEMFVYGNFFFFCKSMKILKKKITVARPRYTHSTCRTISTDFLGLFLN